MAFNTTTGYSWVDGEVLTAAKLNDAGLPSIADGQSYIFSNTGLIIKDTGGSNSLAIVPGSAMTSARTLTLTTGDGNRTIDLSNGNLTLSGGNLTATGNSTIDQNVTTTGNPKFGTITTSTSAQFGQNSTGNITVGDSSSSNVGSQITLYGYHSGQYNWQIDTGITSTGFGISKSNSLGGTSFGSPCFQISGPGVITFNTYGAGTLSTDASGNITASSDERLKNIQGAFTRGLSDVKKLFPMVYKWNSKSGNETEGVYAGFIAQNVEEAIPEAVGKGSDGMLTLSDRPILAALVNSIKELSDKIDSLQ